MTNDELQAICESNARAIAAFANEANEERQRRSTNTDEIETLLGAVSSNETACRDLRQTATLVTNSIAESNQRFDTLRSDAMADRQESNERFEALRSDAMADRQESNERFEALRNDAIADRQNSERRFDAQQEIIQTLLAQLIATNQDVSQAKNNISGLSNRVSELETS